VTKKVREEVDEAEALAIKDKQPDPTKLFVDVYVPGSEPQEIRGRTLSEAKYF
jgi:TPP-dependent pyruvate/acetoin dehydrogenase alpha subunit